MTTALGGWGVGGDRKAESRDPTDWPWHSSVSDEKAVLQKAEETTRRAPQEPSGEDSKRSSDDILTQWPCCNGEHRVSTMWFNRALGLKNRCRSEGNTWPHTVMWLGLILWSVAKAGPSTYSLSHAHNQEHTAHCGLGLAQWSSWIVLKLNMFQWIIYAPSWIYVRRKHLSAKTSPV